jgi:mannose-1-phosphate guanylyltransferase
MADQPNRVALILAGGVGERFWPLSRQTRPKQLLPLAGGGSTLLGDTIERIAPLIPTASTYVVTGGNLVEAIRSADLPIPAGNVIAEPAKRNTAGALVFAAAYLIAERGEDARRTTLAVLPADHLIDPGDAFRHDVSQAMATVESTGGLAVIGIPPTRAETGYGYIERAESETDEPVVAYPVAAFREKPDADTAAGYIASGKHYWNSGMFFWCLGDFMEELAAASPTHHDAIEPLATALRAKEDEEALRLFEELENISIDYALMEKARQVWMIPATFNWDDLGAWDALKRSWSPDGDGNVTRGDSVRLGSRNCVVVNEATDREISVALVGVEDLTVVVTDDAVLVTRTDRSQDVREAVRVLKEKNSQHL